MPIAEKSNGKLRIIDFTDLNRATKRHHYHLPTTEGILSKLSNGKIFTKLDSSYRYWQIPVAADSSTYCSRIILLLKTSF